MNLRKKLLADALVQWHVSLYLMNLRKKLLADALLQWHVSQHLCSDIIIPHDGCGEVRRKVPRKLPGDRESSVPTNWDRTLSQLVGTELSLSPGRIRAHNPNLPGYREIQHNIIGIFWSRSTGLEIMRKRREVFLTR